jgi:hypothetical protein
MKYEIIEKAIREKKTIQQAKTEYNKQTETEKEKNKQETDYKMFMNKINIDIINII